jgi:hypothetical protein
MVGASRGTREVRIIPWSGRKSFVFSNLAARIKGLTGFPAGCTLDSDVSSQAACAACWRRLREGRFSEEELTGRSAPVSRLRGDWPQPQPPGRGQPEPQAAARMRETGAEHRPQGVAPNQAEPESRQNHEPPLHRIRPERGGSLHRPPTSFASLRRVECRVRSGSGSRNRRAPSHSRVARLRAASARRASPACCRHRSP